jgi:hypothetical protein
VVERESSVASNREHIMEVSRAMVMERMKTMSKAASAMVIGYA